MSEWRKQFNNRVSIATRTITAATDVHKQHCIYVATRQMLTALWGEPEVNHNVVVLKHNAYRLTVSVQCAVNRF